MRRFWTFFLDKNHFTVLLAVVLILGGLYSVLAIPKESSPEVQIPVGVITTILPGASAEDVERLITNGIEDRVLGVERVSKVTSASSDGVSAISVEFEASAPIDKSIDLLKDEVDKAKSELPDEAEEPSVTDVNFADQPIVIVSISGNLSPAELTTLGNEVKDELERVEGVSEVVLSGVRERQVQVIIEQAKLRQYGLSVSDITNALRASGLASPIGSITVDGVVYSVRLEAGLHDTAKVGEVALSGPGEAPLYIRDVAKVIDGLADARTFSRVSTAGEPSAPALTLSIFKNRGGNIVATGNAIKERLSELEEGPLATTETVISYDAAKDVEHDLTELSRVGIETVLLVTLMLFLTLGWRESLVAAASIPLSFLIAFIGLYASGNTINFVSLFSLILAIGILVDSGIVVVEAIHTRLVRSANKQEAAVAAIQEYAWPLIAGTFTTVAVFAPLFFLSGIIGKFVASIPFTVIFVLVASIFVALGLIPLLTISAIRPKLSKFEHMQEEWNEKAKLWYGTILRSILGNKKVENRFLLSMLGLFVVALILPMSGLMKVVFFPPEDFDFIYVEIEKPQGTELVVTDFSVREVEEMLYEDPRVTSFVTEVGAGSSFSQTPGSGAKFANITVNLSEDRKETSTEVVEDLRRRFAPITSARVTVTSPEGGPPTGAPILITLSGEEEAELVMAVERVAQELGEVEGAVDVTTSTRNESGEFVVALDTAKAAELGVSPLVVAETLRTALFGNEATDIRSGGEDIEVRVKLDLNTRYEDPSETTHVTIDAVRELMIPGARESVPLSAIATIGYESASTAIRHEDGKRIETVSSQLSQGANAIVVGQEFEKRLAALSLPPSVEVVVGGENEDIDQSFQEMFIALIAGLALMLAILVLEFNSFRHSFYLLSIVPLSLIGVFFGLTLTGQPLSFSSMLGVIALAGVIINHAIILMDSIARIGHERVGKTLIEVVIEAASIRFRPIVLTTITTVVGMIPLSLASALWGPLAFAIMFGLAFAMVLTLIWIPVLYHRWPGSKVRAQFAAENGHETTLPAYEPVLPPVPQSM